MYDLNSITGIQEADRNVLDNIIDCSPFHLIKQIIVNTIKSATDYFFMKVHYFTMGLLTCFQQTRFANSLCWKAFTENNNGICFKLQIMKFLS